MDKMTDISLTLGKSLNPSRSGRSFQHSHKRRKKNGNVSTPPGQGGHFNTAKKQGENHEKRNVSTPPGQGCHFNTKQKGWNHGKTKRSQPLPVREVISTSSEGVSLKVGYECLNPSRSGRSFQHNLKRANMEYDKCLNPSRSGRSFQLGLLVTYVFKTTR